MRVSTVKAFALASALVACACPKKAAEPTSGAGSGSGTTTAEPPPTADVCVTIKDKVEQLYRADAQVNEPKRVDEATADNLFMVMADCAENPAKVAACVKAAASVKEIETKCLARIDEAGNPLP